MKNDTKYNIICLSNQLWDFPNWTNKKHVMSRLAEQGHKVLFVDPPIYAGRVFSRQIFRGHWSILRFLTCQKKDKSGTRIYTPVDLAPFPKITSYIHSKTINFISKRFFDPNRKTLLWIYHVEIQGLENYLSVLNRDFLIYDCVDNYESFPLYDTPKKKEWIKSQEKFLAEKADIVFATTPLLVEKLKESNLNVFFTPNVGDYEKFRDAKKLKGQIPEDIKDIPRPRIGFAGSLDEYKFDFELMKKVVNENPNYSFILIGQIALKDRDVRLDELGLTGYENIYLLGVKPYELLEYYYAGFDAYIIPYQLNDYTIGGCFPVKFHDALAAGLPTIVTDLPAYSPFGDVCYISKNYESFSANLRNALEEDNDMRIRERKKVAKENSWNGKVEKMLNIIGSTLPI